MPVRLQSDSLIAKIGEAIARSLAEGGKVYGVVTMAPGEFTVVSGDDIAANHRGELLLAPYQIVSPGYRVLMHHDSSVSVQNTFLGV